MVLQKCRYQKNSDPVSKDQTPKSGTRIIVSHWYCIIFNKVPKCVELIKMYHISLIHTTLSSSAIPFIYLHILSMVKRNLISIFVSRNCTIRPYISLLHQTKQLLLMPYYILELFTYLLLKQFFIIRVYNTRDRII